MRGNKMLVAVGSENPVKLKAVEEALRKMGIKANVMGKAVPSGVSEIPFEEEVFEGAKNRVRELEKLVKADLYIGLESGIFLYENKLFMQSVAYVKGLGKDAFGLSPGFELPIKPEEFKKDRKVFFEFMRKFGEGLGKREGLVGRLTKGIVTRKEFCELAIIMALSKLFNEEFLG